MPSTDWDVLRSTMEAFDDAGLTWALLHGSDSFGIGRPSDLDVAIDLASPDAPTRFLSALARRDLHPLLLWPNDLRGSGLFVASTDLKQGAQIDLLVDPSGSSKYGIRTSALLSASTREDWPPRPCPADEWIYSAIKRWMKGQHERLEGLLAGPPQGVSGRIDEVLRSDRAAVLRELIAGGRPSVRQNLQWRAATSVRLASRLASPVGRWFHVVGANDLVVAQELNNRLGRVVLGSTNYRLSTSNFTARFGVHPDLWRARALVTTGARPLSRRAHHVSALPDWRAATATTSRAFIHWASRS